MLGWDNSKLWMWAWVIAEFGQIGSTMGLPPQVRGGVTSPEPLMRGMFSTFKARVIRASSPVLGIARSPSVAASEGKGQISQAH